MNSIKNIILLELLYKQASRNKDQLLDLFMHVVDETDLYKRLESILNSNIFIGTEAAELHQNASNLLNEVRVNPQKTIYLFFQIENLVLTLERKKRESEAALMRLDFFDEKPSVVSKSFSATSTKFYEEFYKALTYLTVILFGVDGIQKWSAFPMGSFTDLVCFMDSFLTDKIKEIKSAKKKWAVVEKFYPGGRAGVSFNGCELIFEEADELLQIGPHKHPYLKIGNAEDKKLVEGYGFITGVSLHDVTSLFEGELVNGAQVHRLSVDPMVIDRHTLYNPIEFLTQVLGSNRFILSPDVYVRLLNKYFLNQTIIERRNSSKCLLCGRSTDIGNTICPNHFDYTQNQ